MEKPTPIDLVFKALWFHIDGADAEIAKFAERIAENPVYALERADEVMLAAASRNIHSRLVSSLEHACAKVEAAEDGPVTEADIDKLMQTFDQEFATDIRLQGVSNSTSGSHRLMNQARAEVAAKWFDNYGFGMVSREGIRNALLALL